MVTIYIYIYICIIPFKKDESSLKVTASEEHSVSCFSNSFNPIGKYENTNRVTRGDYSH